MRLGKKSLGRALVVDDESPCRVLHQKLLEAFGFHPVDIVASGSAALTALQQNAYQLLVTDFNMPGMTGLELLDQIKQKHLNLALPVIIISSEEINSLQKRTQHHKPIDLLPKPVKPADLRKVIALAFKFK